MNVSKLMRSLAAKTNPNDSAQWLPLWMHARDTAGIMEKLWKHWLPAAVRREICGGSEEALRENEVLFQKVCVFLGMAHDIGKATAVFQARILEMLPEVRERLAEEGLEIQNISTFTEPSAIAHALAGQVILQQRGVNEGICEIVGAHHGKPQEAVSDATFDGHLVNFRGKDNDAPLWAEIWDAFLRYAVEVSGIQDLTIIPELSGPQRVLLSGLLVMADWVASNQFYHPTISIDELGREDMYPKRTRSAWKKLKLPAVWSAELGGMDEVAFAENFGFSPNELQKAVLEISDAVSSPGILIVEAQMGVGKTEAALAAAETFAGKCGSGGLFFGLPTQATANGIFPRIRTWAEEQVAVQGESREKLSIRLAHGKAELNQDYADLLEVGKGEFTGEACIGEDEDKALVVHSFFRGRKQVLLSDFVIATVDQILMAALKQKHLMLRHLGMAGKIVIIDEVHAYDAYMGVYLERALCWLGAYHVPVILLSATLPASRRIDFVDAYLNTSKREIREREKRFSQGEEADWRYSRAYPLLTWTDGKEVHQKGLQLQSASRSVAIRRVKESERIQTLREKLRDGGCAIVILSTIRRAQEFAKEVREQMPDADIVLLHSAFLIPDRAARERELLQKLGKHSAKTERDHLIVIGTSVLEQSLDIDGDVMLTDLCPMDLLLQRLGRLHRHPVHDAMRPEQLKAAQCYVIEPDGDAFESGTRAIYGDYLLMRTKKRLPDKITLPADIPNLVQDCYDDREPDWETEAEKEMYGKAKKEEENKTGHKKTKADSYCLDKPRRSLENWISNVETKLDEEEAQAQVRDSENSIEVLLFVQKGNEIHYLPWQHEGQRLPVERILSPEEKRDLLRQSVKLPGALCREYQIKKTLEALKPMNELVLSGEWKHDPMLREESFLLLNEQLETELAGFRLWYSEEEGLFYEKGAADDKT